MKQRSTLLGLVSLACLLVFASPSLAEDTAPPAAGPGNPGWCKENPERCAELRAKHEPCARRTRRSASR